MKLTDEIVKALHGCIEDGFDSVQDFAQYANVSANTISKYMRRETMTIQKDTWEKIHPLIQSYLPRKMSGAIKHELELTADQKILLDAFGELPREVQDQKLLEIVELAKKFLREKQKDEDRTAKEAH